MISATTHTYTARRSYRTFSFPSLVLNMFTMKSISLLSVLLLLLFSMSNARVMLEEAESEPSSGNLFEGLAAFLDKCEEAALAEGLTSTLQPGSDLPPSEKLLESPCGAVVYDTAAGRQSSYVFRCELCSSMCLPTYELCQYYGGDELCYCYSYW